MKWLHRLASHEPPPGIDLVSIFRRKVYDVYRNVVHACVYLNAELWRESALK